MPHHRITGAPVKGIASLSPRELKIARLYARGASTGDIEAQLGGIATARTRILDKLDIGHQRQLVPMAEQLGAAN
jgi:DNA-binding CsgD family transcriptional regulator